MRDQQAYLDFAFLANAKTAGVAKQIIRQLLRKPAAYSYFVGCSTGGREGMILSMRLCHRVRWNRLRGPGPAHRPVESCHRSMDPRGLQPGRPEDASGKPQIDKFLTDDNQKLFIDALMKRCNAKQRETENIDGVWGCDFRSRGPRVQARPVRHKHRS